MKPYSSLYPKSKNNEGEVDGPKGDEEMWRAIKQAMEDDTLDRLRHSKDSIPAAPPQKKKATKDKKDKTEKKKDASQKQSEGGEQAGEDDDGEASDGGFFE